MNMSCMTFVNRPSTSRPDPHESRLREHPDVTSGHPARWVLLIQIQIYAFNLVGNIEQHTIECDRNTIICDNILNVRENSELIRT